MLPRQWRHSKIIPLKKPNKRNYTIAKAWRPISLLATLGKILKSVVAEMWRGRWVLSLISFDVKGAYNGAYKERLLQRMKARGIPADLLRWVEAFCSERTATIQTNGQVSEVHSLPQAGLPLGSPLLPTLFLSFKQFIEHKPMNAMTTPKKGAKIPDTKGSHNI
ncbi:hypothetical protein N7523_005534 [Penicillium sp. IBT 18751x]|nr:hypothetical protein N7523_005880 [Penicillium sp. IBT 18751x]KAJ6117783.1 hypothetical protein N7523_005534 [Penicillium sp. IBT 18751x]